MNAHHTSKETLKRDKAWQLCYWWKFFMAIFFFSFLEIWSHSSFLLFNGNLIIILNFFRLGEFLAIEVSLVGYYYPLDKICSTFKFILKQINIKIWLDIHWLDGGYIPTKFNIYFLFKDVRISPKTVIIWWALQYQVKSFFAKIHDTRHIAFLECDHCLL